MYRNSPKSLPDWVCSDAKILVGGFGRGKGKTRAVAEKASKFGGKVLILVSLLPQKKVIQNYLSEMNVSASTDISLAAIDFVSRIKHQYDLVIIDEPDYTLTDRILSHIGQARQWAKQIAVIGSVYTLESDCIVEFDVDGTPYVRCKPKSNLLYLMSLFADDKDAELIITSSTLASTDRPIDIELQFQQGE